MRADFKQLERKEALLKDYTELSVSAKETIRVIPKWFKVEDIPYAEMPEDDMHWYPKVIEASIVDEEKKIPTAAISRLTKPLAR